MSKVLILHETGTEISYLQRGHVVVGKRCSHGHAYLARAPIPRSVTVITDTAMAAREVAVLDAMACDPEDHTGAEPAIDLPWEDFTARARLGQPLPW